MKVNKKILYYFIKQLRPELNDEQVNAYIIEYKKICITSKYKLY